MPHVRSVSIGVWLTRGSRHEPVEHEGIAHFVEHMLFKGTRDAARPRTSPSRSTRSADISTRSRRRNTPATSSRCSTSTCRWPSTSSSDLVTAPAFDADEIEREKKVVLEEIKMVEDTPDDLVHEIFAGALLARPSARPADPRPARHRRPRSTATSCSATSRDAYVARNFVVAPSGNIEHAQVRDLVARGLRRTCRRDRVGRWPTVRPRTAADVRGAHQGTRAEPRVPRRAGSGLRRSRSLRRVRAQHHARRLDELAAVPERAREARPGLRRVLQPERLPRRRRGDDLRRLRQRRGAASWSTSWWPSCAA